MATQLALTTIFSKLYNVDNNNTCLVVVRIKRDDSIEEIVRLFGI